MKSASAKLQTNLVGRKVHLITDEEVREEARKQEYVLAPEILKTLTAESWFPAMKQYRQRFGNQIGEIVAVHLANEGYLVYTIAFGGQLVQLNQELWRLHAPEATTEMHRFASKEEGASIPEYGLLLALLSLVCITAMEFLGGQLNHVMTALAGSI